MEPPPGKRRKRHQTRQDRGEAPLQQQSPAEFFARHQNIAGFDNAGKSLFTTVREFVENALDAAEAAEELPEIQVAVERLSVKQFVEIRGLDLGQEMQDCLGAGDEEAPDEQMQLPEEDREDADKFNDAVESSQNSMSQESIKSPKGKNTKVANSRTEEDGYFRVTCKDNGTGMEHHDIPQMLGIVLSSTKYGLKQTRGKFGLGAKMALVWSKKSTGLPIEIRSCSNGASPISYYKLDIDIYKNRPNVLEEKKLPNDEKWRGTEISVVIRGRWASYRSKIISYLRQLAIITPYSQFKFQFSNFIDPKKSFSLLFARRTDKMPPLAKEVKYHPSSVDNLLVESLINYAGNKSLRSFLSTEFSNISTSMAKELQTRMGNGCELNPTVKTLTKAQIHHLTTMLRKTDFSPPDGSCLSPAGEYNLRLGIFKEVQPDLVSTFSSQAAVFEGHPFIIEAGVSIGGKNAKVGITVYRFANRIPLLFEGSNDVISKVANTKIKWSSFKIKPKVDKIGVFVSIVSTKIPFKGTSKEYIGDDKEGGILHETIKHAISECCKQLRRKLQQEAVIKEADDRKKSILKYVPDISRSVYSALTLMIQNKVHRSNEDIENLFQKIEDKQVDAETFSSALRRYIQKNDQDAAIDFVATQKTQRKSSEKFFLAARKKNSSIDNFLLRNDEAGFSISF